MNSIFRDYAFARAFRLELSEKQVQLLAALCSGDAIATYSSLSGGASTGLVRRGLSASSALRGPITSAASKKNRSITPRPRHR